MTSCAAERAVGISHGAKAQHGRGLQPESRPRARRRLVGSRQQASTRAAAGKIIEETQEATDLVALHRQQAKAYDLHDEWLRGCRIMPPCDDALAHGGSAMD